MYKVHSNKFKRSCIVPAYMLLLLCNYYDTQSVCSTPVNIEKHRLVRFQQSLKHSYMFAYRQLKKLSSTLKQIFSRVIKQVLPFIITQARSSEFTQAKFTQHIHSGTLKQIHSRTLKQISLTHSQVSP